MGSYSIRATWALDKIFLESGCSSRRERSLFSHYDAFWITSTKLIAGISPLEMNWVNMLLIDTLRKKSTLD